VVTLTDQAAAVIRDLTTRPGLPAQTGLRIAPQDGDGAGGLALSLTAGPHAGDQVTVHFWYFADPDAPNFFLAEFDEQDLVSFTDGDSVTVSAEGEPVRFLLISGRPIREPIAWYGPIVMNTQEELRTAFEELEKGAFIKHRVKE